MSSHRNVPAGVDPARHLSHARAALREAAECLEEAIAVGQRADANVADAISHVAAARAAIKPHELWLNPATPERDAA